MGKKWLSPDSKFEINTQYVVKSLFQPFRIEYNHRNLAEQDVYKKSLNNKVIFTIFGYSMCDAWKNFEKSKIRKIGH